MDPLDFISSLAREAGALLRERLNDSREIAYKRPSDLVTDADRASETLIVERIQAAFPGAAILGEEGGSYAGTSGERFIVDPLDGTTNYAHRYPMFCVSIGFERDGVLEAGAIYAPMFDELFAARRGGPATCNDLPIRASSIASVEEALVCTGFTPRVWEPNGARFEAMQRAAQGVRRDGSAALNLAYVAAGRFDAFWEWNLKPWDVAAGSVIIEAAGGRVSTIEGAPHEVTSGSILAANAAVWHGMHAALSA